MLYDEETGEIATAVFTPEETQAAMLAIVTAYGEAGVSDEEVATNLAELERMRIDGTIVDLVLACRVMFRVTDEPGVYTMRIWEDGPATLQKLEQLAATVASVPAAQAEHKAKA